MSYPRIRNLREGHDWNQTTVAKMLGMSQTGYSKYETGENDIPTAILIKLAALYQTSVDYLLGITDERKPYPQAKRKYRVRRCAADLLSVSPESRQRASKGRDTFDCVPPFAIPPRNDQGGVRAPVGFPFGAGTRESRPGLLPQQRNLISP